LFLSDGAVIVSGVWGRRLRLWSDHEETHGREHLSRCLSHPIQPCFSLHERPDSSHSHHSVLWDTFFSALTRVSKHSTLSQSDNSHKPWIMLRLRRPHWFRVDSQSDAVQQEKYLFEFENFSHHGLCSDPVGPMVAPRKTNHVPHRLGCSWFGLTNANKKILELSWFYFEHPFGHVSTSLAPTGAKFGKREEPIR
jgi:hypothetical protein